MLVFRKDCGLGMSLLSHLMEPGVLYLVTDVVEEEEEEGWREGLFANISIPSRKF